MIWGYHYFWKHPYYIHLLLIWFQCVIHFQEKIGRKQTAWRLRLRSLTATFWNVRNRQLMTDSLLSLTSHGWKEEARSFYLYNVFCNWMHLICLAPLFRKHNAPSLCCSLLPPLTSFSNDLCILFRGFATCPFWWVLNITCSSLNW